ncbi:MAG: hypothetical protein KF773_24705 [Deltaproteobacteria bacterium]|nr:hypothetical protein [Deltaproteobacteria bacterium]
MNKLIIHSELIDPRPRATEDGSMTAITEEFRGAISYLMRSIAAQPEVGGEYIGMLMFLSRGRRLLEGVQLLAARGYRAEAFAVSRSLTECAIDIAYILRTDTKARMDKFFNYIHLSSKQRYERLAEQGIHVPEDQRRSTDLAFAQVASSFNPKQRSWDLNVKQRAEDAGRLDLYKTLFDIGSAASHSSPEGMFWGHEMDFSVDANGRVLHLSERDATASERLLPYRLACLAMVDLLVTVMTYMDSDACAVRVKELWERVGPRLQKSGGEPEKHDEPPSLQK